ncbi:hypothetical protein [Streptomyces shenzhenensis]|uniref:hypothetical protein n=1 Tax=Streptomyces shenzhenensis TaxID=943815 RepID=UPI001F1F8D66|nr:hypothetical protein [Streptomyces shenzhenensis]
MQVEAPTGWRTGWRDRLLWSEVCAAESPYPEMARMARESVELLTADRGRLLGFARIVGRRR